MMALAPSLTTVTVNGKYVDYEGRAIEGQIRFSISEVLRNGTDDQLVAPSTVVVALVNGAFSVVLPATNDPDIVPNPFTYTVEESFVGGRTYTIQIPYDTVGSLDLADISPTPTLSTRYVQLIDGTSWNSLTNNINTLDGLIDQSTNTIPATGKYWYISAGYNSYTAIDNAFSSYTQLNAATYGLQGADISGFVTTSQSYASQAASSATTASNNAAGTLNPLFLIGG